MEKIIVRGHNCFSEQGDLESDLLQRTTRAVVFRLDVQVLLSLQR